MVERSIVDFRRLVAVVPVLALVALVLSFATLGSIFVLFAGGALVGAAAGLAVFALRSGHGLGASLTAEHGPRIFPGINMARIPVAGVGGLGLVAMAAVVAFALPGGRVLMMWSVSGAIIGAASVLMWRHFHDAPPFDESLQSTLHLR